MGWLNEEKIVKLNGQCFNRYKCKFCPYWHVKTSVDNKSIVGYLCTLFNQDKSTHQSLHECDERYGTTYDGLP